MATRKRKKAAPPKPRTRHADSKISAVTVYADRAMITRVAHLALKKGEKKKLTFNYDVEFPKDRDVAGV